MKFSKRQLIILIFSVLLVASICVTLYLGFHHPVKKTVSYRTELKESCQELVRNLISDTIGHYTHAGQYATGILSDSSDLSVSCVLNSIKGYDEYAGTMADFSLKKNHASKVAAGDIRISYKGIPFFSAKASVSNQKLKLMIPKLYNGLLSVDTTDLSSKISNSMLSMFIPEDIDLSVLDNLDYDNIFTPDNYEYLSKAHIFLINDFKKLYPDDIELINKNVTVDKVEDGYILTIKKAAIKTFVSDFGNYLFDSPLLQAAMNQYLRQVYLSDPHISDYFEYEDYKEQYVNSVRGTVTSTTYIIADLINFDMEFHFVCDEAGRITGIFYSDGNNDLSLDLKFDFSPTRYSANMDGYIDLNIMSDHYKLQINRSIEDTDSSVTDSINISTSQFDIHYLANLYKESDSVDRTVYGTIDNNTFNVCSKTEFSFLTDKKVGYSNHLETSINSNKIFSFDSTADMAPARDDVMELSGDERSILDMKLTELYSLVSEITDNINTLKGQFN